MTFECLWVIQQQCIDKAEQLHHTFILSQIFMSFQQIHIVLSIAANHSELSRPLLRGDHSQIGMELCNANNRFSSTIETGHAQIQVMCFKKSRRNVLQFQVGKLWQLLDDTTENLVVKLPRLIQIINILSFLVSLTPFLSFLEIATKSLMERLFTDSFRSLKYSSSSNSQLVVHLVYTYHSCIASDSASLAHSLPLLKFTNKLTLSSMLCKGSKVVNMASIFLSPKYSREASSRPSCHISCHKIATRMSS